MLNIVLLCQFGASTGMLVEQIKRAAAAQGEEAVVNAYSFSNIRDVIDGADVILLGPQIRFQKAALEKEYADKGVPFTVIDTQAYGMLNGDKIYLDAKTRIEEYNSEKGGWIRG